MGSSKTCSVADFRQLLSYQILIIFTGNNKNILHRNYLAEPVKRLLKQGSASTQYIQKLFGFLVLLNGQKRLPIPPAIIMQ